MEETTTPLDEQVATEVRAELGRQGISKSELARRMDMTWPQLNRRITGKAKFSLEELTDIAEALNVDVAQFLRPVVEAVEPKVPRPRAQASEELPAGAEQLEI